MDIAGHVSKNMLKHYSHIRMEAKRDALELIVRRPPTESVYQRFLEFEGCIFFSTRSDQTIHKILESVGFSEVILNW